MKNYRLYFTKGFITLIDELLYEHYSLIQKEDFLHFFYLIERKPDKDNMVALPSSIRESFGTKNRQWKSKIIVDILEENNIITSTSYSNMKGKNYCKSYGYTNEFIEKVMETELDFILCDISDKTYEAIRKHYTIPTDPILLKHYETIKNLNINIDKATDFARQYAGERLLRVMREIITIHTKDKVIVVDDPRTARIFTSFNMMKKELRECCSFEGKELSSLDLKSSQPYLLSSILLNENPHEPEVQKFYELVTKGDLYDWLSEIWGFKDIFSYDEARDMSKKMFFNYLYKKNQGTNSAQMLFSTNYPVVYDLIKNRKRKEELWLSLQKLEASIFIPVANKFVSEGCLSVHDSLYFPEGLRGNIESSLHDRFNLLKLTNYNLK